MFYNYFNKISNLFTQLKKLYIIKKHLNTIYETFNTNDEELQLHSFQSLKQLIFDSGSLYIKFFQWYISKLKASTIKNDSIETTSIIKFINYFEDIFEQCPYHDLKHTKIIFKNSMNGITLDTYIDINTLKPIAS